MPSHTLRVSGEVAEIFEKDGRNVARIVLKSGFINVSSEDLTEAHLGDQVLLDLEINVRRAQPVERVEEH
jgi:hypothetical protein